MTREHALLQTVLEIWSEVLGGPRPALTADSNLFLSGGDSLDLLRIMVRLRERLGVAMDLHDAAHCSTPRKMAVHCAGAQVVDMPIATAPGARLGKERFPCSSGQVALWLAELASGASGLYNAAIVLQLSGQLDAPALARAIDALVTRHEILRVRMEFDVTTQQLYAVVGGTPNVVLKPATMPAHLASGFLQNIACQPFELESGPLWRLQLVAVGPLQWCLLVCMHHIITDAWSGNVLLNDLAEFYNAALRGESCLQSEVDREFRSFCLQPQAVQQASWSWWRNYLRGADQLRSWPPTGSRRWPFAMACDERLLDAHTLQNVFAAVRTGSFLPAAFFLGALRLALRALAGVDELCIGMPVSARNSSAQERSIGYFVNLVVTRVCIADLDAGAVLTLVQQNLCEVMKHRAVDFPDLARDMQPELLPSGNPWCDTLFSLRQIPEVVPAFDGLEAILEPLTPSPGQYPLKVEFVLARCACTCRIEYAHEVLSPAQVSALHAELVYQVAAATAAVWCNN